jgi:hypothetical protein
MRSAQIQPSMPALGYMSVSACGCHSSGTFGKDDHFEYKCEAHRGVSFSSEPAAKSAGEFTNLRDVADTTLDKPLPVYYDRAMISKETGSMTDAEWLELVRNAIHTPHRY